MLEVNLIMVNEIVVLIIWVVKVFNDLKSSLRWLLVY